MKRDNKNRLGEIGAKNYIFKIKTIAICYRYANNINF